MHFSGDDYFSGFWLWAPVGSSRNCRPHSVFSPMLPTSLSYWTLLSFSSMLCVLSSPCPSFLKHPSTLLSSPSECLHKFMVSLRNHFPTKILHDPRQGQIQVCRAGTFIFSRTLFKKKNPNWQYKSRQAYIFRIRTEIKTNDFYKNLSLTNIT